MNAFPQNGARDRVIATMHTRAEQWGFTKDKYEDSDYVKSVVDECLQATSVEDIADLIKDSRTKGDPSKEDLILDFTYNYIRSALTPRTV